MEQKVELIIAQNLIELRKNRNLKQSELSEAIGYSDKTISRWENGTSVPDISTLIKLAEYYNVTINDIITENAASKSLEEKKAVHDKKIRDYANLALAVLTVWLLATLIFLGTIMMQKRPLWESFLFAIPISSYFAYRNIRFKPNMKWWTLFFISFATISLVTSIHVTLLTINNYNFWLLYILLIPLEGMCIVNTLLKKKERKKKKEKKSSTLNKK